VHLNVLCVRRFSQSIRSSEFGLTLARTVLTTVAIAASSSSALAAIIASRTTFAGCSLEVRCVACFFHEVGDVKERVAFQPDVNKA
jgi:hypothetical protein